MLTEAVGPRGINFQPHQSYFKQNLDYSFFFLDAVTFLKNNFFLAFQKSKLKSYND